MNLLNRDLNRTCLVYMFSFRFSGSKFLTNLRWQFRVRKIFRAQGFAGFTVFLFCVYFLHFTISKMRNLCCRLFFY